VKKVVPSQFTSRFVQETLKANTLLPEKKKYPGAVNKLNAHVMSRKYGTGMDECLALRRVSQSSSAAARLANAPPASTRRESKVLDQATS
jgi:hypothetical protein